MLRSLYLIGGFAAVALGIAGILLPLLPTVPFMILAAFCFARSSPRFEARLIEHPVFGPHIIRWRTNGAISRRSVGRKNPKRSGEEQGDGDRRWREIAFHAAHRDFRTEK